MKQKIERMPYAKDLKKLAMMNARQARMMKHIVDTADLDTDGLELQSATLITGCTERNGKLYRDGCWLGNNEGEYYCEQHQGYIEDCFHGYLYFKTDVPGEFVRIFFDM